MTHTSAPAHGILIPQGAFIMGTDIETFYGTALANSEHAKLDEAPMHVRFLESYFIEKYPVTNAEYAAFVRETGHRPPPHWKNGAFAPETATFPVVHVSWHDSNSYARWAGKRLPTEAEWEKACRGPDGRTYPWGDAFVSLDSDSTEPAEKQAGTTQILTVSLAPVGTRPATASPYGVGDAVGNVWQWTEDWYHRYPEATPTKSKEAAEGTQKVLRGGSWLEARDGTAERYFRCANRLYAPPDYAAANIGFRCVREVLPGEHTTAAAMPRIPMEPLIDYVRQQKLRNLRLLQKRAAKNSLKDVFIAACLIAPAVYVVLVNPEPEALIASVTAGIVGLGFLFSAGVNFWRRWRAGTRARQVESGSV